MNGEEREDHLLKKYHREHQRRTARIKFARKKIFLSPVNLARQWRCHVCTQEYKPSLLRLLKLVLAWCHILSARSGFDPVAVDMLRPKIQCKLVGFRCSNDQDKVLQDHIHFHGLL